MKLGRYMMPRWVILRRNNAKNMLKLRTRSNTGSDTLTRPDPAKIADPVTSDP